MRYVLSAVLAAFIMTAAPAYPHRGDQVRGEVGIEIVSDGGSAFRSIPHRDFWKGGTHIIKKYLEAKRGESYGIVIRNTTPERIGVVIAVDGRNIISGKRSDLKNSEDMYIVNGYEHARYDGWRTARDQVHKFYFTGMDDSYAMRTFGDSSSMGVIAVAVFREKERPLPLHEQKREMSPAAPSAEAPARSGPQSFRDESAGTGFGDAQYSPTVTIAFEPQRDPVQKTLVKYEWRETLCRKGILYCRQEPGNRLWDEDEYAPYPPGYPVN